MTGWDFSRLESFTDAIRAEANTLQGLIQAASKDDMPSSKMFLLVESIERDVKTLKRLLRAEARNSR